LFKRNNIILLFTPSRKEFRKVCAKAVRRYRIRENKQPRTEQHKVHHPMASMSTVRLTKGDSPNWGFRLQGGKDFGTPLVIQKVNGGSPAERAGLIAGDAVIKINNVDVYNRLHKEAQDVIVRAGSSFEMVIQRGGSTWKPSVIPTGTYSKPSPSINNVSPVTKTSLAAQKGENIGAIGTGHNLAAKPFSPQVNGAVNGAPPKLVNKQYNSPLKLYSEDAIAETISAQSEVLSTGALGVNFKKNEKDYDATNSAVYRMLKEAENDAPSNEPEPDSGIVTAPNRGMAGLRHVEAPQTKAAPSNPQLPPGQNVCADCERLIVGVFVRIKDKNLHVECFKCATCGSSLKNVGYYNINNKLYCDIHAKSAAIAINNPAAVPIIPAGVKAPVSAISSALSGHSLPSPSPLSPKTPSFAPSYPPPQERPDLGSVVGDVAPQTPNQTHDSNPKSSSNSSLYNPSAPVSFSKFINKPSTFGGPKPFSSVSAPLSPGGALNRGAPLSPPSNFNKAPLSPPIGHSKSPYSPAPSEEKPACIRRETIIQEKRDQKSKHVEQVVQRKETVQRQAEEVIQVKPAQVNAMLHKPQSLPGYQKDLQATAEADLILMERKRRAEERIEEQRRQAATKPIITIEPSEGSGDHQSAPAAQGPFITALGKIWCPQHFTCNTPSCKRPLQDLGFVEEQGQLYCEYCFEQYLAPPCSKCNGKIKGVSNYSPSVWCGQSVPFSWHALPLNTCCCLIAFPWQLERRWPGHSLSAPLWFAFVPKHGCCQPNNFSLEDCLRAIGKNFHPECFNCVYCGKLFGNNPFFLEDGNPYCDAGELTEVPTFKGRVLRVFGSLDWNELFTTKCFACGFPVEAGDRWVEALNNNYHSQCFNCTMCKKNLEGQSFFAKGGRPFCKTHAR
ncbi:hypothetical protein YQE_07197, partial [Dendroctonus ponderosae]